MLLIPAIDLKDGHCVRLKQGEMDAATVFSVDPRATARHWIEQGARRLHVVDLNGAFAGKPKNQTAIKAILAEVKAEEALNAADDLAKTAMKFCEECDGSCCDCQFIGLTTLVGVYKTRRAALSPQPGGTGEEE